MKPRDYCCCALPIIDAGVYATLTEQFVLGVVVGTLSLATPSSMSRPTVSEQHLIYFIALVVGAVTPAMAPWILAIVCFIASGIQGFGFIGVAKASEMSCGSVPLYSTGSFAGKAHHFPQVSDTPHLDHDRSIQHSLGLDHHVRHSPFDRAIPV
jgi:hypothetical protein